MLCWHIFPSSQYTVIHPQNKIDSLLNSIVCLLGVFSDICVSAIKVQSILRPFSINIPSVSQITVKGRYFLLTLRHMKGVCNYTMTDHLEHQSFSRLHFTGLCWSVKAMDKFPGDMRSSIPSVPHCLPHTMLGGWRWRWRMGLLLHLGRNGA